MFYMAYKGMVIMSLFRAQIGAGIFGVAKSRENLDPRVLWTQYMDICDELNQPKCRSRKTYGFYDGS